MRVYLRDQSAQLASHLREFRRLELNYQTTTGLPETTLSTVVSPMDRDLRACDLDFLFRYEVFPPGILKFFGEWQLEGRAMRIGDTIMQQAQIPPRWGFHLVFAVRVLTVSRDERHMGFSYGTLAGHPETGVNEFSFSSSEHGVEASVRTIAAPALPLSRFLAPWFTKPYVAFCNRQALARMGRKFIRKNQ